MASPTEANNDMMPAAVVDLDGTLIGCKQVISARVARAVSQLCIELPVCIATGREPADTIRYARQLGLTAPQICDGGATSWTQPPGKPSGPLLWGPTSLMR